MSYPLKPVCVSCRCFYRCEKNGYMFMEGMPNGLDSEDFRSTGPEGIRGKRHPELWQPYKLWRADLWKCPDCGHEIVSGFANSPMSEHYLPNFKEVCEAYPPEIQVNDC